ncbi:MAG: flavodoxin domain-containing protein [Candidatus Odinarchaeota archaeon]
MTAKRVLISYGSRYGATEDTSRNIARILETDNDFGTEILDLRKTKENAWPSIEGYDGIIIGSGVRVTRWTKESTKFLRKCKEAFEKNKKVLGFFISCGYSADPKYYPIARKDFLEKKFEKIGIKPDLYDAFGGIFDFSESTILGYIDRKILTLGASDLSIDINYNERNDYRNWNQIRDFCKAFAELILSQARQ